MSIQIIVQGNEAERDAIGSLLLEVDDVSTDMLVFQEAESASVGLAGGTEEEREALGEELAAAINQSSFLSGKVK